MNNKTSTQQIEMAVLGMTCDACARHVTKALQGVEGVVQVEVPGWTSKRAILSAQPGVDEAQLISAVKQAGYHASLRQRSAVVPEPPPAPDQDFDFDLAVIGTGGGGMAAAIKAAELGRRAVIIEAGVVGGTCVNIGCV
ncbi:MAG: cation transporter, partial [Caldilineales bacterium]|nr:cation transporter [Caldilineales bacterium]